MTPEQIAAFMPALGTWMTAGLLTGWLYAYLRRG
jgi:hypothetical protein